MYKVKSFFFSLPLFIVFTIFGISIGTGVGYIIVVLNEGGAFDSWKLLSSPLKFERIIDANSHTVWAESKNEKLLYYKDIKQTFCDNRDCNQWIETSEVSDNAHFGYELPAEKDNSCHFDNLRFLRKPPGIIVECARGWYAGPEFGTVAYYALLEDGTIWKWDHHGEVMVYVLLFLCLIPTGFILGMKALGFYNAQKNDAQLPVDILSIFSRICTHILLITGIIHDKSLRHHHHRRGAQWTGCCRLSCQTGQKSSGS